ncbi:MAG: peptidoglycan DD-metalloendopeptidase family protein [Ilumatobacteraceae bacterium]
MVVTSVATSVATSVVAGVCWLPPVHAPVVDPFRPPACVWCEGNRGIQYGTGPGVTVRAVATGTVTFTGTVAGIGYVVVRHADGRRATYGGVVGRPPSVGAVVIARAPVGTTHRDLHFGLRDGDRYVDPAAHLGRSTHRARLVPLDGSPARPAPPPRPRCGSARRARPPNR